NRHRWLGFRQTWTVLSALLLVGLGVLAVRQFYPRILLGPTPTLQPAAPTSPAVAGATGSAAAVKPAASTQIQDEGIPVIVVLPFQDLTGDRMESELGKGIAEEFITDLASFPDYEVVSSETSFAYAGRPVPDIVKATGAVFVIEGSIRRS